MSDRNSFCPEKPIVSAHDGTLVAFFLSSFLLKQFFKNAKVVLFFFAYGNVKIRTVLFSSWFSKRFESRSQNVQRGRRNDSRKETFIAKPEKVSFPLSSLAIVKNHENESENKKRTRAQECKHSNVEERFQKPDTFANRCQSSKKGPLTSQSA